MAGADTLDPGAAVPAARPGPLPLAGVIGWPVAHSLSPRLHGHWLARHGLAGAYLPLAVAPAALPDALRGLVALGFRGANVTIPHKEATWRLCQQLSDAARRIGAVNTLVVQDDGRLLGDNTDWSGWRSALLAACPGLHLAGRAAAVLGAGGAARAVIVALVALGATPIRVANRGAERVAALARDLDLALEPHPWPPAAALMDGAGLLVNTTSLGMAGQPPLAIDLAPLPGDAVVNDIVYRPLDTPLLAAARARGLATVDGLGMLLHQAAPGFAAWFGPLPVVDQALRDHVLAALAPGPVP